MAIAFDAATNGGSQTTATLTFSHTCTGTNRLLFVDVVGDISDTNPITGVTYAGVSMTQVTKVLVPGNRELYTFVLPNPASGANNVVISCGTSIVIGGYAISYIGAAQTQSLGTDIVSATNTGSSVTTLSVSTTSQVDNSWAHSFILTGDATNTAGANTTKRLDETVTYGLTLNDNNAPIHPAGSITETMNWSASHNSAGIIATFSPFGATPGPQAVTHRLTLMGVGQ